MNKRFIFFLILVLLAPVAVLFGQKVTFDLVNFSVPSGWAKSVQNNGMVLSSPEKDQGGFCIITIFKNSGSSGNIKVDFSSAWKNLAAGSLNIKSEPEMQDASTENGWTSLTGSGNFQLNGINSLALLTVISDNSRVVTILSATNNQEYFKNIEAFYESISMNSTAQTTEAKQTLTASNYGSVLEEYTFETPPGWRKEILENEIALYGPDSSSIISILPVREGSGDLEKDASTFFWQIFEGWKPDEGNLYQHISFKGVSPDGWSWYKDQMPLIKNDGERKLLTHGFVFVAQLNGKVALIVGSFNYQGDLLDEVGNPDWLIFFHSLGFKNFKASTGSSLASDILGLWMTGSGTSALSYTFSANGHYATGSAFRTSHDISYSTVLETTTTWGGDGKYTLEGNELTMIKDSSNKIEKDKVRVFYQRDFGDWQKRIGLLCKSVMDGSIYEVTLRYQPL